MAVCVALLSGSFGKLWNRTSAMREARRCQRANALEFQPRAGRRAAARFGRVFPGGVEPTFSPRASPRAMRRVARCPRNAASCSASTAFIAAKTSSTFERSSSVSASSSARAMTTRRVYPADFRSPPATSGRETLISCGSFIAALRRRGVQPLDLQAMFAATPRARVSSSRGYRGRTRAADRRRTLRDPCLVSNCCRRRSTLQGSPEHRVAPRRRRARTNPSESRGRSHARAPGANRKPLRSTHSGDHLARTRDDEAPPKPRRAPCTSPGTSVNATRGPT